MKKTAVLGSALVLGVMLAWVDMGCSGSSADDDDSAGNNTAQNDGGPGDAGVTLDASVTQDAGVTLPDGGGSTFTVSGYVTRSVAPADGGDAFGTLYLVLNEDCVSSTGSAAPPVGYVVIPDVDLAPVGARADFVIEHVPVGTWRLNGFLEDFPHVTSDKPFPGKNDLVSFGTVGPKCVDVKVENANITGVHLDLNFLMPFDL